MSDEKKMEAELAKANLVMLKAYLFGFIKKHFSPCDSFTNQFNASVDEAAIVKLLVKYNKDVFEKLGGEPDLQDEVDDLERDNRNLENDIEELENELEESRIAMGTSLDDEFKRKFIIEHHNKYTPWELEELLKNGKKYLKQ